MNDRTSALLGAAQESLREQLEAAERTFERLQAALVTRDSSQIATLNRAVRRIRAAASGDAWSDILVGAAQVFSGRAALFTVRGNFLGLEAARGFDGTGVGEVPLSLAPAFRTCVETQDSVVAIRTSSEMSPALASRFGEAGDRKFYLFPVTSRDRVIAVLYADAEQGNLQPDALELLATVAGALVEPPGDESLSELVSITAAPASECGKEQDLHLKAQRFARVRAAEIRLYKSENVKNGRAGHDLYASLKTEIDSARDAFHRDFISQSPTMADYLHEELVRTLANDDVTLLGPDYPGPML
jgi:hypothetical protein